MLAYTPANCRPAYFRRFLPMLTKTDSKPYQFISSILTGIYLSILVGCVKPPTNVEIGNKTGVLHWGNGTEPKPGPSHCYRCSRHHIISALMEGLVLKDSQTLEPKPGWLSDGRLAKQINLIFSGVIKVEQRRHSGRE